MTALEQIERFFLFMVMIFFGGVYSRYLGALVLRGYSKHRHNQSPTASLRSTPGNEAIYKKSRKREMTAGDASVVVKA